MVDFKLGEEIEIDVIYFLQWIWDKDNIVSPYEEANPSTEPQRLHGEHASFMQLGTSMSKVLCV